MFTKMEELHYSIPNYHFYVFSVLNLGFLGFLSLILVGGFTFFSYI